MCTCSSAAMRAEQGASALFQSALSVGVLRPPPIDGVCVPAESLRRPPLCGGGTPVMTCPRLGVRDSGLVSISTQGAKRHTTDQLDQHNRTAGKPMKEAVCV